MKMKSAIILVLIAVSVFGYAFLPSPNAVRKYQLKPCAVATARHQDLSHLMSVVMSSCRNGQYGALERVFEMSAQDRRVCKEMEGIDPVEVSLEVLKLNAAELQWSNYEMNSYEKNPGRFEVKAKTRDGKKILCFTFRVKGKHYYLLSVAEV